MKANIRNFTFILLMFILSYHSGRAQEACEDSLNFISEAYKNGEWSICKNAAINFIKDAQFQDADVLSSRSAKKQGYSSYCKNNISQVYYYLIKSYLRLYDLDGAKFYYFDALKKEVNVDFDSTDQAIMNNFGKVNRHSYGLYIASVSTNFKEYRIFNEFKLGAVYGLGSNLFLELSYTRRSFNHDSKDGVGIFGKPLKIDPAQFPNYNFLFKGNERFLDLGFSKRFMIYRSNRNDLYFSTGLYANYYLNSYVNEYEITINNSTDTSVISSGDYSKRYERIDTLNMDLKRLYSDRLNYGLFISYGSVTKLANRWELFAELRFTLGKNYSYAYPDFQSYKVGVDYVAIVIGVSRRYNKIKAKNNLNGF